MYFLPLQEYEYIIFVFSKQVGSLNANCVKTNKKCAYSCFKLKIK